MSKKKTEFDKLRSLKNTLIYCNCDGKILVVKNIQSIEIERPGIRPIDIYNDIRVKDFPPVVPSRLARE